MAKTKGYKDFNLIENEQEAISVIQSNMPTSGYEMLKESLRMAIDALEMQIPKKPFVKVNEEDLQIGRVTFKKGVMVYKCSACDSLISRINKFCPKCGSRIDWSAVDENNS